MIIYILKTILMLIIMIIAANSIKITNIYLRNLMETNYNF